MKSGIYMIKFNEHFYVGSAVDLTGRKNRHLHSLRNNKHCNTFMQNLYNKYGEYGFKFVILEECKKEQLIAREQYYIDTLKPDINICKIAGSTLGIKLSDETKRKLSETFKGMQRSKGRIMTSETREKIREKAKQRGLHHNTLIGLQKYRDKHIPQKKEIIRKRIFSKMKLSKEQIYEILDYLKKGFRQVDIAKIYNVGRSTISNINVRKGIYKEIVAELETVK